MSAPDTSPEAVERLAHRVDSGHHCDNPECSFCEVAGTLRALSSQLQEAQQENERLKNEIHPKRGDDAYWTVSTLCQLAEAHRSDSIDVDAASAGEEGVDYAKLAVERHQRLQEAHRHLGTALDMVKVCRSYKDASSKRLGRWCANCGQAEEFHNPVAAARAYSRAHGGQP